MAFRDRRIPDTPLATNAFIPCAARDSARSVALNLPFDGCGYEGPPPPTFDPEGSMYNKLFAALAALVLAFTLSACGDKAKEDAAAAKASADQAAAAARDAAAKSAEAAKAASVDAAAKSAEAAGKSADASKDAADKAVEAAKEAAKPAEAPKK